MLKNIKFSFLKEMGITGRLNKNGEIVFRKIGMTAERIKTDPAYRRTRENGAEFGRAAQIGKLIRRAFYPALTNISNPKMSGDLVKMIMALMRTDPISPRGERTILNAKLDLLSGYEFNERKQSWATSFPITYKLNKAGNQLMVKMKSVSQQSAWRNAPDSATHVRICPVLAVLNPQSLEQQSFYIPGIQPVSTEAEDIPQQQLAAAITIPGPLIIITAICIEFFMCHNNHFSPHGGKFNSLTIVNAFHT
ncbi:MAG TPA: hypothetical protein VGM41_07605 [Chitinophagaceae bacterium]|jgi:hypothetical protein